MARAIAIAAIWLSCAAIVVAVLLTRTDVGEITNFLCLVLGIAVGASALLSLAI